jgi:hypothetical protein
MKSALKADTDRYAIFDDQNSIAVEDFTIVYHKKKRNKKKKKKKKDKNKDKNKKHRTTSSSRSGDEHELKNQLKSNTNCPDSIKPILVTRTANEDDQRDDNGVDHRERNDIDVPYYLTSIPSMFTSIGFGRTSTDVSLLPSIFPSLITKEDKNDDKNHNSSFNNTTTPTDYARSNNNNNNVMMYDDLIINESTSVEVYGEKKKSNHHTRSVGLSLCGRIHNVNEDKDDAMMQCSDYFLALPNKTKKSNRNSQAAAYNGQVLDPDDDFNGEIEIHIGKAEPVKVTTAATMERRWRLHHHQNQQHHEQQQQQQQQLQEKKKNKSEMIKTTTEQRRSNELQKYLEKKYIQQKKELKKNKKQQQQQQQKQMKSSTSSLLLLSSSSSSWWRNKINKKKNTNIDDSDDSDDGSYIEGMGLEVMHLEV